MRLLYIVLIIIGLSATAPAAFAQCAPYCPVTPAVDIGSGPLANLKRINTINTQAYESGYMELMYQQNADIMALAQFEVNAGCNSALKTLSRKIFEERYDQNEDLRLNNYAQTDNLTFSKDSARYSKIIQQMSGCCGTGVDCAYASAMICLMKQAKDAADCAICNAHSSDLVRQARVISQTSYNEIIALQVWMRTGTSIQT